MAEHGYSTAVNDAEEHLLLFLRTFDSIQENMRPGRLAESQQRLRDVVQDGFADDIARLTEDTPTEEGRPFHDALIAAIRHVGNAAETFLGANDSSYPLAGIDVRRALYRGLNLLYGVREHTPTLRAYWVAARCCGQTGGDGIAIGGRQCDDRVDSPQAARSLGRLLALRAGELYAKPGVAADHLPAWAYGRGDHYIWSWLRPAKGGGYMLLAPKSLDVTWSILQPERDTQSVAAMLEEVCGEYAVDRRRVYLSGLSDGGTFTYLLGLGRPELFAGIAPVAGDFTGMMDDMLRRRQGVDLPICIVHGAHDHIFPVDQIRKGHGLLQRLGYDAKYEELPDWGHSYCGGVNERLVMPWIQGLARA